MSIDKELTVSRGYIPHCPVTPEHPEMLIGSVSADRDKVTADRENEFARNCETWD